VSNGVAARRVGASLCVLLHGERESRESFARRPMHCSMRCNNSNA
jgi:hypothetical protein